MFALIVECCSVFLSECRYIALDLAGHGLSSHHPPGVFYSFAEYVTGVRQVVDGA